MATPEKINIEEVFRNANTQYVSLCKDLEAEKITPEEFVNTVKRLEIMDPSGKLWKIRPHDGIWFCLKGQKWVRGIPPGLTGPLSILNILFTFLKSLPKMIIFRIIFGLAIAGFIWILHTFLLVYVNEGFAPSNNPLLEKVLCLKGNMLSGTMFWGMLSAVIPVIFFGIIRARGPVKYVTNQKNGILRILQIWEKASPMNLLIFTASLGIAAATSMLWSNNLVNFLIFLFIFQDLVSTPGRSLCISVLSALSYDFKGIIKNNEPLGQIDFERGVMIMSGVALAMLGTTLPYLSQAGFIYGILAFGIGGVLFVTMMRDPVSARTAMLFIGTAGIYWLLTQVLQADDGGWQESGGTLADWVKSQGAVTAVAMGAPPALSAGVGSIVGSSVIDVTADLPPIDPQPTEILDGAEAEDWMKNHGFLDANGNPTDKYKDWANAPYSEPNTSGLQGFAGHTDESGAPDGDYVIAVKGTAAGAATVAGTAAIIQEEKPPAENVDEDETPDENETDKTPQEDKKSSDKKATDKTDKKPKDTDTQGADKIDEKGKDKTGTDTKENPPSKDTQKTKPPSKPTKQPPANPTKPKGGEPEVPDPFDGGIISNADAKNVDRAKGVKAVIENGGELLKAATDKRFQNGIKKFNELHDKLNKFIHNGKILVKNPKELKEIKKLMKQQENLLKKDGNLLNKLHIGKKAEKVFKGLSHAIEVFDGIDRVMKVSKQRGYNSTLDYGCAVFSEVSHKILVYGLTKNPVIGAMDGIISIVNPDYNIESLLRKGEDGWHKTTKEFFDNIYDNSDKISKQLSDQFERSKRRIMSQNLPRAEKIRRLKKIYHILYR